MNETFKNELGAFVRDLRALCKQHVHCADCPHIKEHGLCDIGILSGTFDPDKAIAAVDAYRKRTAPCKTVVDAADDIVLLKVTVHRHNRNTASFTLEETVRDIRVGIDYILHNVHVETEILSSDREILKSHEEVNATEGTK